MNTITVTYTNKFQLDFAPEYKWTKCGKLFNNKTGRQIKKVSNNSCIGYTIRGKFYSLTKLKKHLVKIENVKTPF